MSWRESDRALAEWLRLKGERKANLSSCPGKAVTLVERVVSLVSWTNSSYPDLKEDHIECVAFDHVVWFAERMLKLQTEYANQGFPSDVDVGYHYTYAENLEAIRTNGLLTRGDLKRNNLESELHGCRFGDGVYTSSNPAAFSAYGNVGLIVGRLQGTTHRVTRRLSSGTRIDATTIIGDRLRSSIDLDSEGWPIDSSYNEVVLRTSSQCLPLIKYNSGLVKKRLGQECLAGIEQSLGLILRELFNVASQQCDQDAKSSPLRPSRTNRQPSSANSFLFGAQANGSRVGGPHIFTPHPSPFASPPPNASAFSHGTRSSVPESGYSFGERLSSQVTSQPFGGCINNFSTFGRSVKGTSTTLYQPTTKQDGTNQIVLTSITAMSLYEHKSFEELRLEDYGMGNTGMAREVLVTPYQPPTRTDDDDMCFHSLTILPQYQHKSFEELRLEDYFLGNRGSAAAPVFSQPSLAPPAPLFFGAQPMATGYGLTSPSRSQMPSQVQKTSIGLFGQAVSPPRTAAQQANVDLAFQTLHYVAPLSLTTCIPSDAMSVPPPHCNMSDDCVICHEKFFSDLCVTLVQCKHTFHHDCIQQAFKSKPECPICRERVGAPQGKSPSGVLTITSSPTSCSGFEHHGSIVLKYVISSGYQLEYHENPGAYFNGKHVKAFLPNSPEGHDLLKRLKYAFSHGLTFTVGTSVTTQRENQVCWGSIHHKTSTTGGVMRHGYPDDNYFANCNGELDGLGVPPAICLHYDGSAFKKYNK